MALISNMPTFTYVKWTNMIISHQDKKYTIQNSYTNKTYIYWSLESPYQLFCTNEKQKTTGNLFLIAINEKGIATQVPHDDIAISYDGENPDIVSEKIFGIYEKNKEFGDKFVAIEQSVEKIDQTVGTIKEEQNSVKEEVSRLEQTSNKIEASVSKVEKTFNDNLEATALREGLNKSIIDLISSLGIFKSYLGEQTKVPKIEPNIKMEIQTHLGAVNSKKEEVILHTDKVLEIMEEKGFTDKVNSLNSSKTKFLNALNNLTTVLNSIISDNVFVPSEITMITDIFGKAIVAVNELKNSCDDCIQLGVGGSTSEELARLSLQSDKIILSVSKVETNMSNNLSVEQSHVQSQVSDILTSLGNLQKSLSDSFKDGKVTEAEKAIINDNYVSLTKEKDDLDTLYNTYYNNKYLSTSIKDTLKQNYDSYNSKHTELKSVIDRVIEDSFVNEIEMTQVDAVITSYEIVLNQFHRSVTNAIKDIDTNRNDEKIDKAKEDLQKNIDEVGEQINNLDITINTTFKNNIIDESEKKAISQNIKSLETEKSDVDKQFEHLYGNKFLEGDLKKEYSNAYNTFIAKYNFLIDTLNGIVNKQDLISETDRENMNRCYSELNTALSNFTTTSTKVLEIVAKKEADSVKSELNNDITDVNNKVSDLGETMHGSFKDGVLSEAEKLAIKQNLKTLETEKLDIDKRYLMIYNDSNLEGDVKTSLKSSYDNYILKYNNLVSVVNNIVNKVGEIVESDKTTLDTAFTEHNLALANFSEKYEKAIDSLTNKSIEKTKKALQTEIGDVNSAIGSLESTMNGVFKDGILSDSEKLAIKQNLQTLLNEKTDIDKQYETLYSNEDLEGDAKSNLKKAYDDYSSKYLALVGAINTIVNKEGIVDGNDKRNLDRAFENHRTSLGTYSTRVNQAIDAIAYKKASTQASAVDKKWSDIILDPETGIKATVGNLSEKVTQSVDTVNGMKQDVKTVKENVSALTLEKNEIKSKVEKLERTEVATRKVASFRYIRDWLGGSTVNDGNHWCELEVWAGDTNIVRGITPTTNATVKQSLSNATDGNRHHSPYAETINVAWAYIQVDLGSDRTDVDMIKTWHYWGDGRAYNHRLEVSRDGQTWYELFNSEKSGRYKETIDGRTYVINETYTEHRLKIAEQKVTADAIVSTVKQSQTNGKNTFVQGTELEQTKDEFNFKIENSNSPNEVENSNLSLGSQRWSRSVSGSDIDAFIEYSDSYSGVDVVSTNAIYLGSCEGDKSAIYAQTIYPRSPRMTEFTVSACYHYDNVRPSNGSSYSMAYLYIEIHNKDGTKEYYNQSQPLDSGKTYIPWETYSTTYKRSGKTIECIVLHAFKRNTTGIFRITQIDLHEGGLKRKWTPSLNEIKNKITTINGDGVKVKSANESQFARMDNQFFSVYNGGDAPVNRQAFMGLEDNVPTILLGAHGINPGVSVFGGTHLGFKHYAPERSPLDWGGSWGMLEYKLDSGTSHISRMGFNQIGNIELIPHSATHVYKNFHVHGNPNAGQAWEVSASMGFFPTYIQQWNTTASLRGIKVHSHVIGSDNDNNIYFVNKSGIFSNLYGTFHAMTNASVAMGLSALKIPKVYRQNTPVTLDIGHAVGELITENVKLKEELKTSLLATVDVYEMILSINPKAEPTENVMQAYQTLIKNSERKISDLPEQVRKRYRTYLG